MSRNCDMRLQVQELLLEPALLLEMTKRGISGGLKTWDFSHWGIEMVKKCVIYHG